MCRYTSGKPTGGLQVIQTLQPEIMPNVTATATVHHWPATERLPWTARLSVIDKLLSSYVYPQFSSHIRACGRISVSVKACRQANSNNLKLSGTESVISIGSCLQHHAQENIPVLVVLAGNPDNAPVQNQWPATDHRKSKKKKKKANQTKPKNPTHRAVKKIQRNKEEI